MEKVFFIGGRRGFGLAVLQEWQSRFPHSEIAVSSRQPFSDIPDVDLSIQSDLAQPEGVERAVDFLREWRPQRLFCFAGGGPYGKFADKNWKDHRWALQVSLLAPLELVHAALQITEIQQIVVIGSSIAESQPDPNAASYCAAKHGLMGAISTLQQEDISKDIRIFSPGYMATDMVPPPQRLGKEVADPARVAEVFVSWALDKEASWHGFYQTD